jgi:hypothetical protein
MIPGVSGQFKIAVLNVNEFQVANTVLHDSCRYQYPSNLQILSFFSPCHSDLDPRTLLDPDPNFNLEKPVLRIRIQIYRIHMFLGLLDPDPFVRGMDPHPSIIKQK